MDGMAGTLIRRGCDLEYQMKLNMHDFILFIVNASAI